MKHLQTYEKKFNYLLYEPGDYVLVFDPDTQSELPGKIFKTEVAPWPYRIDIFKNKLGLFHEGEVLRKLTPEEIEEFELKKKSMTYNI